MDAHKHLGISLATAGDFTSGKAHFERAIRLSSGSTNLALRAEVENCLGITHARLGNTVAARVHFNNALTGLLKLAKPVELADTYVNIGNLNIEIGDLEAAMQALQKSREIAKEEGYLRGESIANINLGDVYVASARPDEALHSYRAGKTAATEALEYRHICCANTGLGVAKRVLGSLVEAREYLEQAAYESERLGLGHENAAATLELAILAIQSGELERAGHLLNTSLRRFRAMHSTPQLRRALFFRCLVLLRLKKDVQLRSCLTKLLLADAETSSRPLGPHDIDLAKDLIDHLKQLEWPVAVLARLIGQYQAASAGGTKPDSGRRHVAVKMLGISHVSVNGVRVPGSDWTSQRAYSALMILACNRAGKSAEELTELLWPESVDPPGRGAIYSAVHRARSAIGADVIAFLNGRYAIDPDVELQVDVEKFFELSALAESPARRPEERIRALQEADRLYEGEFLPEVQSEWTIPIRRRAENQALTNLARLAALQEANDDLEGAVSSLRRMIRIDPTNSQAHANVVRLLAQSGRVVEAKTALGSYKKMMKDDPDIGTMPEFRSLAHHTAAKQRSDAALPK